AKLRMWDTAQRNGVLIYLLLAEHAIELVADRGLAARVPPAQWQGMVGRLGQRLADGAFEDGLTQALEEVSAALVEHFPEPLGPDGQPLAPKRNELPDAPVLG
ncbi:MAG: TPM domain-containing protein, partial [Ottowia sp.]|nr:TPM domain-containing protein [Ottowia sp.]